MRFTRKKTIVQANKSYVVQLKYIDEAIIDWTVERKHFIGKSVVDEYDYKMAALKVSKRRTNSLEYENTVFESCDKYYYVKVEEKSHGFIFKGEENLIISIKPLITMQCEKIRGEWVCEKILQRYAIFSESEHFLKHSLQLSCENVKIVM